MRKYLPLAPNTMPGVWKQIKNMVPTRAGSYYTGNPGVASGVTNPVGATATRRAWSGILPSGSAINYVGTTTQIYQFNSIASGYTDRSRGGGYTNTTTDWSFAQFGNISIACNRVDATQYRDASGAGAFADLAGAPKARIVVTQQLQVLLFDLNDGAEKPDYFIACAPGDYTTWTGASATGPNPIWQRPGKIRAAIAFRDYVLVFKRSSVFKLTYTGATFKWKVELIATNVGAWGMHDVVNTGDSVIFSGPGGVWRFDGSAIRCISELRGEISDISGTVGGSASSVYSPYSGNVFFFNASGVNLSGTVNVYNIYSDAWGDLQLFTTAGALIHDDHRPFTGEPEALSVLNGASSGMYSVPYPDGIWLVDVDATSDKFLLFDGNGAKWGGAQSSTVAYLVGGVEGAGGRTVSNFTGLDLHLSLVDPAYANSAPSPTELLLDVWTGDSPDDSSLITGSVTPVVANVASSTKQKRFDFAVSAPYAEFKLKIPGDAGYVEISDYTPIMSPAGSL